MPPIRVAATAYVAARVAFALGLASKPDRVAGGWIGSDAQNPPAQVALRGLAGRDLALSGGTLAALGDEEELAAWIAATVGADLSDLLATLATPRGSLPSNARWGTVALAGGAVCAGAALVAGLVADR